MRSDLLLTEIITGVLLAYIIFGMILFSFRSASRYQGSYLVEGSGQMMQFRPPAGQQSRQRCFICWIDGLLALAVVFYLLLPESKSQKVADECSMFPAILLLTAAFTYLAGPNEIRLDAGRRTYEWTVGWPWRPGIRRGTFEEIRGIQIMPQGSVVLLMRRRAGIRSQVALGSRMSREQAAALAQKVSQATGISVVS